MFKEHRFIYQQTATPQQTEVDGTTEEVGSIELGLQLRDVDIKMEALEKVIVTKKTTAERMGLIQQLVNQEQSEHTFALTNTLLSNERAAITQEREQLKAEEASLSPQEIAERLKDLYERTQLVIKTREHVDKKHQEYLSAQNSFIGKATSALASLTDVALPEVITTNMSKERKAIVAIAGTVGLAVAIPVTIAAAKFAWNHSPMGWLFGKFTNKERADTQEESSEKNTGVLGKMLGFTAFAGLAVLAGLGIKKYVDMYKEYKKAQEALASIQNTDVPDVNVPEVELPITTEEISEQVIENSSRLIDLKAFMFQYREELGDLDTNKQRALQSIMSNKELLEVSPEEFKNEVINTFFENPNEDQIAIYNLLKEIVINTNTSEYATMHEFFNDTVLGKITAGIHEAIDGKNITEIDLRDVASSALANGEIVTSIAHKANVKQAFLDVGLPEDDYNDFLLFALLNNEYVDQVPSDSKYYDVLANITSMLQNEDSLKVIEQFGHGKEGANQIIREQIVKNGTSKLTVKDAIELFVYLQLMKDKEGNLLQTIKDGSPTSVYLMQMKTLDLLGNSDAGENTIKAVKVFLINELIANASGFSINLPQEVLAQLQSLGREAAWFGIERLIINPAQEGLEWYVKQRNETYSRSTSGGMVLDAAVAGTGSLITLNFIRNFFRDRSKAMAQWFKIIDQYDSQSLTQFRNYFRISNLGVQAESIAPAMRVAFSEVESILQNLPRGQEFSNIKTQYSRLNSYRGYTRSAFSKVREAITEAKNVTNNSPETLRALENMLNHLNTMEENAQVLQQVRFGTIRRWFRGLTGRASSRGYNPTAAIESSAVPESSRLATEALEAADIVDDVIEESSEIKWSSVITRFKGGADPGDVRAFLELAEGEGLIKIDNELLTLINESPSAQKIISGAIDTAEVTEIERALRAANRAKNIRIAGNVVGVAGDVFGIYMAYVDWQANGERIEATNNPALKELYEGAYPVYAVEGGTSAVGLVIGVTAITQAYIGGQSLITALGASGGLIMLPVAVTVIGGGVVHRQAEAVTADWLRDEEDWMRENTPGQLLQKLKELGPGQRGNFWQGDWQGWGKSTIVEQGFRALTMSPSDYMEWEKAGEETIESANNMVRYRITKAYVLKTSILPGLEGETESEYKNRFEQFVVDQMIFIGHETEHAYGYSTSNQMFDNARLHAELMAESRALRINGESRMLTVPHGADGGTMEYDLKDYVDLDWEETAETPRKKSVISHYRDQKNNDVAMQISIMQQLPTGLEEEQKELIVRQQILNRCAEALHKLDGRIGAANFNGVMGDEAWGEALARYTAYRKIDAILEHHTTAILQKAKESGVTREDFEVVAGEIESICFVLDVVDLQNEGQEHEYIDRGYFTTPESTLGLLQIPALLHHVHPETISTEEHVNESRTYSEEEKRALIKEEGENYLYRNQCTNKGEYFQVQFGNWFNKYLYAKCIDGKWNVAIGGWGNGPWKDPSTIRAVDFGKGALAKYNRIIRDLDAINNTFN